jgi:hypothetical protein
MELITFVLFLTCQKPQLINESEESWTKQDEWSIQRAIKVCATDERYSDTPCLKTFYKRAPQTYGAICGVAHKRSW